MTDTTATQPMPPIARRVPTQRTHHGDVFVDDYEWPVSYTHLTLPTILRV